MSITTEHLSKSGTRSKELDAIVRGQLLIIDERIIKADKTWGRNIIAQDLPTNFIFPGLKKKDAQRIIYTAIIRSLQDRGFNVRIYLNSDRTTLYIEWVTNLNNKEIDMMNQLIQNVRISADELKDFLVCSHLHTMI